MDFKIHVTTAKRGVTIDNTILSSRGYSSLRKELIHLYPQKNFEITVSRNAKKKGEPVFVYYGEMRYDKGLGRWVWKDVDHLTRGWIFVDARDGKLGKRRY